MKKIILILSLLSPIYFLHGQILKKIADRVKNKTEAKVENKVDKSVDAVEGNSSNTADNSNSNNATVNNSSTSKGPASFKTYSKYDFVPGERIIVFEDFMQDAVGDFPAKWNTNSSGETVTLEGKQGHWFMLTKPGFFVPEFIDSFPDNFTLEYDLLSDQPVHSWGLTTSIVELQDRNKPENWQSANNRFSLNILPGIEGNGTSSYDRRKSGVGEGAITTQISQFTDINKPVHVAFWRQKERLRVYLNEEKTWDIPKAFAPDAKLNSLIFWVQLSDKWRFLINNLRLGVGAPDTRNKLLKENKWVTHGILFDVNSATIKPESSGSLKEIATVLKENPDLKVKIVGHTDSDGKDADNLDLSKRRAAAVKVALSKEFGIDESKMETDGKGESEPIDKNDTPAGKANNRRVEFIKV